MCIQFSLPVIGFAAFSGTGKTTLLRRLIPMLNQQGLRVGLIKQSHHPLEIDKPGKDSYELRKAGAAQTLVASKERWALINENRIHQDPNLSELIAKLDSSSLDLILVEGFKHQPFPKIELHRPSQNQPLLFINDDNIIAVASDAALPVKTDRPLLDLSDVETICDFILEKFNLHQELKQT